jgi:amino acid transporter
MFPTRVVLAMLFYAIVMGAVVVYRPRALFDENDEPRPFGAGKGKGQTVFDLGAVAAFVAIVSFALFTLVDLVAPERTCAPAPAIF